MWIFFKKQMQEKITQASLFLGRKKKELSQCNVKKRKEKKKHQQKDIQIQNIDVSLKRRTNRRVKDEVLHDTSSRAGAFTSDWTG